MRGRCFGKPVKLILCLTWTALAICSCIDEERSRFTAAQGDGTAVLRLQIPPDTLCVAITAEGEARTEDYTVDVMPGSDVTIPLDGVPTGEVVFTGVAYDIACKDVTGAVVPVWITDEPVLETVGIDPAVHVVLTFVRNGQAIIDGTFEEDLENSTPIVVKTAGTPDDVLLGDMVVDPETGYLYAAGSGTNTVYILNSDLEEIGAVTTTGTSIVSLDIGESQGIKRLFVSVATPASIEIFDLEPTVTQHCVTSSSNLGIFPSIAFNPVNELIYAAATNGLTLADSDCNTGPLVDVGYGNLADVAVDVSANLVYIPLHHAWKLLIVDGTDTDLDPTGSYDLVDLAIQGDPLSVSVNPFSHRIYVGMNVGGGVEKVDADPATGLPPYTHEALVVGHAPAQLKTNPILGRVYVSIRNFQEIGTITNGEVSEIVTAAELGMTPNTLAVDAYTHCFYVANHHTNPENRIIKLCEPAKKQLGIAALKRNIKRCITYKATQKTLLRDLKDVLKTDGSSAEISAFENDVTALAGECTDELLGLSDAVWELF